mmetsp:Transcript_1734/g.5452  ORF Transcript_1734/g.5452 Transcript_1734/m.5452 type:complete len:105 (+) Transcript_1734:1745-2059(+)
MPKGNAKLAATAHLYSPLCIFLVYFNRFSQLTHHPGARFPRSICRLFLLPLLTPTMQVLPIEIGRLPRLLAPEHVVQAGKVGGVGSGISKKLRSTTEIAILIPT